MTGRVEVVSLFDVENVEQMPKVRDMTVGPVANHDLVEFAHRYHYSGTANNNSWRWGLWHGPVLHGVVSYNLPTRSVCESVFGPENHAHVWHMGRLILSEESPHNSESRLIGGSLHEITRTHPQVWAVLTYADPSAGHLGTVYQATNAVYTGVSSVKPFYLDADGRRYATYQGGYTSRSDAESRGWTCHDGVAKHRYVYILGSKTQRRQRRKLLKLPVLPYPKQAP